MSRTCSFFIKHIPNSNKPDSSMIGQGDWIRSAHAKKAIKESVALRFESVQHR
jgi:hypothetical protein